MPRVSLLIVLLLVLVAAASFVAGGCADKDSDAKPAVPAAPAAAGEAAAGAAGATPAAPAVAVPTRPPEPPPKPKFQIQLRSTPSGADAALDGRPAGRTPVTVDVDDDGKEHEFTFVLDGHALERYRTRPLKSGVIHARLRAIPVDAGP